MSSICLIDTSVFLNFLNVPSCNEFRETVFQDLKTYTEAGCTFLLPMAAILETGNHIAQNGDGNLRSQTAKRFVEVLQDSFSGQSPWRPIEFPSTQQIGTWIEQFPDLAGQNKTQNKPEGTSLGNLSIIKDFEQTCRRSYMSEFFILSLDRDLEAYRHSPE